jgi:tRNA (cmo5U34)-methyltransferase
MAIGGPCCAIFTAPAATPGHSIDKTMKSTVEEIRERFDNDVERFSNIQSGQSATIDAPLVLDLIAETAALHNPQARDLLDVGCGAGNYALKLLAAVPDMDVTLIDLSLPMLQRAAQRVGNAGTGRVNTMQADIREAQLGEGAFDIITAAAVLHHLRSDDEYHAAFSKLFNALRPGGALYIADLVVHDNPAIQAVMWRRYGEYLSELKDEAYRDHVFAYIEREDTPRSLMFQLNALRAAGFSEVDVLHKNSCFAAFAAFKAV